jgi:arginyl-tRNA synthetase
METRLKEIIEEVLIERQYPLVEIAFRSIPFKGTWGLACSFLFQLLNNLKEIQPDFNRQKVTDELFEAIKQHALKIEGLDRVELDKGFINFYFEPTKAAKHIITEIISKPGSFGKGSQKNEKVMVEYSQPNTHKDFHVGHLRNICLGITLVNIFRFAGYETIAANYLGDIGTHVIKCLWGYKRFYSGMEPESGRGRWLGEVYAFAESKYETSDRMRGVATEWLRSFFTNPKNPSENAVAQKTLEFMKAEKILLTPNLDKKTLSDNMSKTIINIRKNLKDLLHNGVISVVTVQDIKDKLGEFDETGPIWGYVDEILDVYQQWENRDPELVELWQKTRDWSLSHFDSIYKELGANFDVVFFESEMEHAGKAIVKELLDSKLAEYDEGAVVVKIDEKLGLQKETYRNFLILKSDGTSLYATKDLALAKRKFEEFNIDRSIYLVDVGQSYYFQQLFKTMELMGFKNASKCLHLAYGRVSLPDGKMSSRMGNIIHYTDLRNELYSRAKKIVRKKQATAGEDIWRSIAKSVSFGAMKYNMIKIDSDKEMVFDWDEALDFEGRTAPYIQYAHARATKILEKAGILKTELICEQELSEPEIELAKKIAEFPSVIQKCAKDAKPLPLATYTFELAQVFSDFYHRCPVVQEEIESRKATRMGLVLGTKAVIANALGLMGIDAPTNL